jgi:hypothetical protein
LLAEIEELVKQQHADKNSDVIIKGECIIDLGKHKRRGWAVERVYTGETGKWKGIRSFGTGELRG